MNGIFQSRTPNLKLFFSAFLAFLSASLALFAPYALVRAVDDGIENASLRGLFFWLLLCVGSQIAAACIAYVAQNKIKLYALTADNLRARQLFASTLNAELLSARHLSQGEMMSRCLLAAESEGEWLGARLSQGVQLLVTILGVGAILLYLSWRLAAFAIVPFVLVGVFYIFLRKQLKLRSREALQAQEGVYGFLHESFRALDAIQALNIADSFSQRFQNTNEESCYRLYRYQKTMQIQTMVLDILQALLILAVFGYGGYLVFSEQGVSIGILLGFQIYLARVFAALRTAGYLLSSYQHYVEAQKRGHELEKNERKTQFKPKYNENALLLKDASFSFGERKIFQNLNLELPLGQNLAVLGPSGMGKTSLAYCILGLYPLESGSILWPAGDGVDFAFVAQEPLLFSRSLKENIVLDAKIGADKLAKVIDCCALNDLVERHGLDGFVGEGGQALSGGERKRVLLARALAMEPKMLIIDQLSSDLEPETCERIFERIKSNYPRLSIIYLGHRTPEGLIVHQKFGLKAFSA